MHATNQRRNASSTEQTARHSRPPSGIVYNILTVRKLSGEWPATAKANLHVHAKCSKILCAIRTRTASTWLKLVRVVVGTHHRQPAVMNDDVRLYYKDITSSWLLYPALQLLRETSVVKECKGDDANIENSTMKLEHQHKYILYRWNHFSCHVTEVWSSPYLYSWLWLDCIFHLYVVDYASGLRRHKTTEQLHFGHQHPEQHNN